ncbi:MAG TPA: DUF4476 domain-containing protein [Chitinophagaceae bacterium]|nr:DUF4476 domain-containing protein [Chitinophagaceae bacterium]
MRRGLKAVFLVLFSTLFLSEIRAQKVYFIYIQSEQGQPFFVRMDEKIYNASQAGYLILSHLRDSTYQFSIGFPDNRAPELRFSIYLNRRDHGYLLRHFEGKGWGLFDLQTMAVQMAAVPVPAVAMEKTHVSRFTDLLSRAADDSTLKEKPVLVNTGPPKAEVKIETAVNREEKPKSEESRPSETKEEVKKEEVKKDEVKPEPAVNRDELPKLSETSKDTKTTETNSPPQSRRVLKIGEQQTEQGLQARYLDGSDTIEIVIEALKPVVQPRIEQPREERRFLEISTDTVNAVAEKAVSEEKKLPVKEKKPAIDEGKPLTEKSVSISSPVRNNCAAEATESDFFKLRKKMAGESNDYDMIDEARKVFRGKCFSVQQVRNLSALFLSDLGKYMFFDAFYGFVSDPENYASLQSELKEEYYINRFKAMLRN